MLMGSGEGMCGTVGGWAGWVVICENTTTVSPPQRNWKSEPRMFSAWRQTEAFAHTSISEERPALYYTAVKTVYVR